jgi:hypothetical protein
MCVCWWLDELVNVLPSGKQRPQLNISLRWAEGSEKKKKKKQKGGKNGLDAL